MVTYENEDAVLIDPINVSFMYEILDKIVGETYNLRDLNRLDYNDFYFYSHDVDETIEFNVEVLNYSAKLCVREWSIEDQTFINEFTLFAAGIDGDDDSDFEELFMSRVKNAIHGYLDNFKEVE